MRTQIALKNLMHNRVRTALSVGGVCFAIVLIFLQLGFLGAVQATATLIYDKLEYDVMLRSPDYLHLCDARSIPRDQLNAIESHPSAAGVTPFHVMLNNWQHPTTGEGRAIIVMGARPDQIPLAVDELKKQSHRLAAPQDVLIDRKTRKDYGPRNGEKFGDEDYGVITDIGGAQVQIRGHFELGTGLAANGAVLTSERGFSRIALYDTSSRVSMGLVKLKSDTTPEAFIAAIRPLLADGSTEALTRKQVVRRELQRWVYDTPIGRIFQMGVGLAFLVGAAIVYMVLSTDVTNNLSEYATLKAMGYSQKYLSWAIMQQAILLALLAYVPAWIIAEGLYRLTTWLANIPVDMNASRLGLVFVLTLSMCIVSGSLALQKLRKADPAELF